MEKINPFEIEDILGVLAAFLNAKTTKDIGNRLLRRRWLKHGKVVLYVKRHYDLQTLYRLSPYFTDVVAPNFEIGTTLCINKYHHAVVLPKVVRLYVDNILGFEDTIKFPNLKKIYVKTPIHDVSGGVMDYDGLFRIVEKFPQLTDINATVKMEANPDTDIEPHIRVFEMAKKFRSIRLQIRTQTSLVVFLDYISTIGALQGHYKVECEYISDTNQLFDMINNCSVVRFKVDKMTMFEVVSLISSLVALLQTSGLNTSINRSIILTFAHIIIKKGTNTNTLLRGINLAILDFKKLNIDLCINSSIQWLSKVVRSQKAKII